MGFSPEAMQLFNRLKTELMADGFEKISEFSFYKSMENISVSLIDNAINIAYKGRSYGLLTEQEFLQLQHSVQPMLFNIRHLLTTSMRQELLGFLYKMWLN